MKKASRFFGILAFFSTLAFLAGPPSSLFSQTIKEDKTQDQTINSSTPAKMEVQAREEQEKAEAGKAAAQASAEAQAKADQQKTEAQKIREAEQARRDYESILKTYSLKYISVQEFVRAAKLYIQDYSGSESALTVRIFRTNIPAFEDLLKKLDVEKRNIQFQVYTIVASKELPSSTPGLIENWLKNETKEIENRDLKRVLDEMKGLWNFKHYWIDSPSFLMVKDGSVSNSFRLVSNRHFNMFIRRVQVRGDEPGKRTISVGQIKLTEELNTTESTLIDTSDINFKEKGYLVVGISGFTSGWAGMALILVINAEIK
jgi:hypothetical protein